jgi:hypothetical protein
MRYHAVLDGLGVDRQQADRLREAARLVEQARRSGLPTSRAGSEEQSALGAADERPAIEAPRIRQIPTELTAPAEEIFEAEIVEPQVAEPVRREDLR